MRKYLFQRFLPNCDTSKTNLSELYSDNVENMQVVSVTLLDEKIGRPIIFCVNNNPSNNNRIADCGVTQAT